MRRIAIVLTFLVVTAVPAFARLLYHGPHTSRLATSGIHLRDSRYYPLIEGHRDVDANYQIVVYDSTDQSDPRVIYTAETGMTVDWVAYYET